MYTIRLPKWLAWTLLGGALLSLMVGPALSRTKQMRVPIGVVIRDGNNGFLRPRELTIHVFRVGTRVAPKDRWVIISGSLDERGYLQTTAAVPVESSLVPLVEQLLR